MKLYVKSRSFLLPAVLFELFKRLECTSLLRDNALSFKYGDYSKGSIIIIACYKSEFIDRTARFIVNKRNKDFKSINYIFNEICDFYTISKKTEDQKENSNQGDFVMKIYTKSGKIVLPRVLFLVFEKLKESGHPRISRIGFNFYEHDQSNVILEVSYTSPIVRNQIDLLIRYDETESESIDSIVNRILDYYSKNNKVAEFAETVF